MAREFRWMRRLASMAGVAAVAACASASPAAAQSECQWLTVPVNGDQVEACYDVSPPPDEICVQGNADDQYERTYHVSVYPCANPTSPDDPLTFYSACYPRSPIVYVCTDHSNQDICVNVDESAVDRLICVNGLEATAEYAAVFAREFQEQLQEEIANAPQTAIDLANQALITAFGVVDTVGTVLRPYTDQVRAIVDKAIADALALTDREVCTPSAGPPPICVNIGD